MLFQVSKRCLSTILKVSNIRVSCLRNRVINREVFPKKYLLNVNFLIGRFSSSFKSDDPDEDEGDESEDAEEYNQILSDEKHESFVRQLCAIPGYGHHVFLIQPYVKTGQERLSKDAATLKMIEADALVQTLTNWKVADKIVIATKNLKQKHVFGPGNCDLLKGLISGNQNISAVFVNVDRLSGLQFSELVLLFGVPVYDRYTIVLQIFKEHSRTRVSRLQIAVAEIPYLKSRMKWYNKTGHETNYFRSLEQVGGARGMDLDVRKEMLDKRELKLKAVLTKVKAHRDLLRNRRKKLRLPTVAVVGYTNAGKTCLIKSLTGDKNMQPMNHLFATLDVTVHAGFLPSRLQVMYVDTVGFISDIPTSLIDAFRATLEDAILADLIIHVRDLSHPESEDQKKCVLETLKMLNLSPELLDNIIEVGNKIDLVSNLEEIKTGDEEEMLFVSATNGDGLMDLKKFVEKRMRAVKNINFFIFRVPNGGEAYQWLFKNANVNEVEAGEEDDGEYLYLTAIIDDPMINKFRKLYPQIKIVPMA